MHARPQDAVGQLATAGNWQGARGKRPESRVRYEARGGLWVQAAFAPTVVEGVASYSLEFGVAPGAGKRSLKGGWPAPIVREVMAALPPAP